MMGLYQEYYNTRDADTGTYDEGIGTLVGWTCPGCGIYFTGSTYHACAGQLVAEDCIEMRIAKALEQIADALEKLAR